MNKKEIHISERGPNGKWTDKHDAKVDPEPPRNVQEMVDHLNATHGPGRKLKKKGEGDG